MFEKLPNSFTYRPEVFSDFATEKNLHVRQHFAAMDLFHSAVRRGRMYRLWAAITRQPRWLLDLHALKAQMQVGNSHYSGVKTVSLNHIIGSEQGIGHFDLRFYPVKERSRERWVGIAAASLALLPLPVVNLIQVGRVYFVRDGHHRISVARALRQEAIDAEVTTWEYSLKDIPGNAGNLLACSYAEI